MLNDPERATLALALDALLPPKGSFPTPSATAMIDEFVLRRVPPAGTPDPQWPGLDEAGLRALLAKLAGSGTGEMPAALAALEQDDPPAFLALWRLAVFGYYSRPEVIAAIAADLAAEYHGAPLPRGYAHLMPAWESADPLQRPTQPQGRYQPTESVRRVDLARLAEVQGAQR